MSPPKKRPRLHFRFTREGTYFLVFTVLVGLAAVNTGNNLLFLMLSLMLSLILLSMVMSLLVLGRVRIERRLPERAFAGSTCLVEVVLANEKRYVPSYSLEVEDRAEGLPTERRCYFLKVAPRAQQVAAYRRTPPKRGLLKLTGFRLATRYPFGLIERGWVIDAPAELLVYPALAPVGASAVARALDGADVASGRVGPGTEVAGLRAYQPGDEARNIHWRRTASLGRMVVREHERDAAYRLSIVLDNARPENAGPEWDQAFEASVSRAASLAQAALIRGAAVDVVARGACSPVVLPGSPADPIWRWLALIEPIPEAGAPPIAAPRGHAHDVEAA